MLVSSLRPLTMSEIYQTVNSAFTHKFVIWEEFVRRMDTISNLVLERQDGHFVLFHPAFREWLCERRRGQSEKFLCDPR